MTGNRHTSFVYRLISNLVYFTQSVFNSYFTLSLAYGLLFSYHLCNPCAEDVTTNPLHVSRDSYYSFTSDKPIHYLSTTLIGQQEQANYPFTCYLAIFLYITQIYPTTKCSKQMFPLFSRDGLDIEFAGCLAGYYEEVMY